MVLFIAELEEEILQKQNLNNIYGRGILIICIFFLWEHQEEKLKYFIYNINEMHQGLQISKGYGNKGEGSRE